MSTSPSSRLSRLPLRVRLVAGFSAATFLALVAAGGFVYWRVQYALDRSLDTELKVASHSLEKLIGPKGTIADQDAADTSGVAWQILSSKGRVLDHGGPASASRLVSRKHLARIHDRPRTYNVGDFLPVSPKPHRLRVTRVHTPSHVYLVTAVRRDHRDEALRELLVQLAVAGAAMLAFTAFVGDRLAHAALRPVEQYRRQAEAIAQGAADLRLDVPVGRDDEVTRLGHTFNHMLASLERALDRERAFVNEASHELRTPITLLTSRIQLARRRRRSQDEYEDILGELQIDLDRLANLAENLLQVGAASQLTLSESSDLTHVARRVLTARMGASPPGAIAAELAPEPIQVAVADLDVERILTNLIDNAFTHGRPPAVVSTDLAAPGWARVSVTDQGPGMPAGLLATATRRFTRADSARSRPGTGLGLALVQALVARAGGSVRLCHAGNHWTDGRVSAIGCAHGDAMTVTVVLPTPDGAGD